MEWFIFYRIRIRVEMLWIWVYVSGKDLLKSVNIGSINFIFNLFLIG